jgi:hypothetical protein
MTPPAPAFGLAPVNGIELAYRVHETGRPTVLLHGGFGTADMSGRTWRPWPLAAS